MTVLHGPVYTEATECRDCYKCIRDCPVKSIEVKNNSAFVMAEGCISCGRCVVKCPSGAKKVKSDLDLLRREIAAGMKLRFSIAPSYMAYLSSSGVLFKSLNIQTGAQFELTSAGAALLNKDLKEYIETSTRTLHISSACPAVVEYIRKYKPELVDSITPFPSPLQYHSRVLRNSCDENCSIVFAGPCAAKHLEKNDSNGPDYVISFPELIGLAMEASPSLSRTEEITGDKWMNIRGYSGDSVFFPRPGGMISSLRLNEEKVSSFHFSGLENVFAILEEAEDYTGNKPVFLELLACEGGCMNGPLKTREYNALRGYLGTSFHGDSRQVAVPSINIDRIMYSPLVQPGGSFKDDEIEETLARIGKARKKERLNCGGCGYDTCANYARALLAGKAEEQMCVTNMRKIAQKKVNALLKTIPFGVVLTAPDLTLVEANARFLTDFFEFEHMDSDLSSEDLSKLSLAEFEELAPLFREIDRDHSREHILHFNRKIFSCILFPVEEGNVYGGLFRDITRISKEKETIVKKSREVIEKNLNTVQQIAMLLGETAAETEINLNSLISISNAQGYGQ